MLIGGGHLFIYSGKEDAVADCSALKYKRDNIFTVSMLDTTLECTECE